MYQVITSDFVNVMISTSTGENMYSEKKFQKSITVGDLKAKLEMITGGSAGTMKIEVYENDSEKLVCKLDNDNALLGSFPIDDGMRLHVVDSFVLRDITTHGEKFDLTPEEYAKKTGTVREFLAKNRLGKYNEEEQKKIAEAKQALKEAEEKAAKDINVGNRCEVKVAGAPVRRATVMFVGEMDGKTGLWVGLKYDEPLGKNDGSVDGKRYFECPPKYGGFTRVTNVTVGDFPEEEFDLDEI
ncbi:Tubulin-folding cofactor B [Frankliniella fusca]|uniref:Tubulin-folding cofactor B n=1 Tax=Frankliniella fusca TaxID=407009 RepID=A0AAE1LA66_9NEOP|nr:Tubulin-folding cofactor B [Frankliniella fusca]